MKLLGFLRLRKNCLISKLEKNALFPIIGTRVVAGIQYFGVDSRRGLVWFNQKELSYCRLADPLF